MRVHRPFFFGLKTLLFSSPLFVETFEALCLLLSSDEAAVPTRLACSLLSSLPLGENFCVCVRALPLSGSLLDGRNLFLARLCYPPGFRLCEPVGREPRESWSFACRVNFCPVQAFRL